MSPRDRATRHHRRTLDQDLELSGYYPGLVRGVLDVALADEDVVSWLVHPETTFDAAEVRRHLTSLVLTPTRLIVAHVDDDPEVGGGPGALATTESVALRSVQSVGLTHGVANPGRASRGLRAAELTIAVSWGAVRRLDLEPATCPDPNCDADHGYTGLLVPEDIVVRVSARAEGEDALADALDFARALSAATARVTTAGTTATQ